MSFASPLWAYESYKLWLTVFDKRVLTSDGVYAEGNVPEDYAGPELEVQFNQIMVFATPAGRFMEWRIMDTEDLQDAEGKKGVGHQYTLFGKDFSVEATDSDVVVEWYHKVSKNFTENESAVIELLYKKSLTSREDAEQP